MKSNVRQTNKMHTARNVETTFSFFPSWRQQKPLVDLPWPHDHATRPADGSVAKKHISRTMTVSSSESDVVERKKAIWNNRCMYIHIFRCALMQQLASLHSATNGCVYLFRKKNCWLVLRWLKASLAECCRIPKVSIGIVDTQVYYCSRSFKYICTRRSKFQPDAVVGPYSAWRIKLFL